MVEPARQPRSTPTTPAGSARGELGLAVHQAANRVVLVHLRGPLVGSTAAQLAREIFAANRVDPAERPRVLLDLSGVSVLDHAGLDAVLEVQATVREGGGSVELLTPSPAVVQLLHEAELDGRAEISGQHEDGGDDRPR